MMKGAIVALFLCVQTVAAYNFLVFCPLFGHSHTTFFAKIADTLSDAGHNVTFFTPTICPQYANITYAKSTRDVIGLEPSPKLAHLGNIFGGADVSRFWTRGSSLSELSPTITLFHSMYTEQVNVLRDNLELLDELKARKYDVMIFESFVTCAYPVLDYLEIKTFLPASSIVYDPKIEDSIGQIRMPSAIPLPLSEFNDQMSLSERLLNWLTPQIYGLLVTDPTYKSFRPPYNTIDIAALEPHASFVLSNSNPYIDYPRPLLTKNVQIGGVSVDIDVLKSQKVDEEWDSVLNLREKTVLVSFGSLMRSVDMPIEYKVSMVSAMKKFPEVTFIWKYEGNDSAQFSGNAANIHFAKWVPQTALLADSRLSAFLTHAGLGSVNEVSYLGKPTILCPLFADQMRNAKMLARHNGSIELSKYDLPKTEKVEQVFRKILFDESYKIAAEKLAHQLDNQPVKPRELMLRHAEFAAKFGRLPSLDPYSRRMPFTQYFLLDVLAILTAISLLLLYTVFRTTKRLLSLIITLSPVKQKAN